MDVRWVYVTASSRDEATQIGRALLERRLVACVNIIEGMSAMYRWKGTIEEGQEVVLIAKTTQPLSRAVVDAVCELHSYEVPCVVVLPVLDGNPGFLAWVREEVRAP
jgi:periplasmic divalent cation tolerance protein